MAFKRVMAGASTRSGYTASTRSGRVPDPDPVVIEAVGNGIDFPKPDFFPMSRR
jgi:hypothetical protein